MTTVGTITFHDSVNYGAILQTYALQKILTDMGHVSEVIDYRNPRRVISGLTRSRRARHFVWQAIIIKMFVGKARKKKTEEFCRKHILLSSRKYFDPEILRAAPPLYDAYISGSDQVWNPINNGNDSSYFLTFAPLGKKRISYAPSFGTSKIEERFVSDYRRWLEQIDFLSCREDDGRSIVKKLTGRNAKIVLDPTLLLDQEQWRQLAVPYEFSKPYILCYYMPGDKEVNKSITKIARYISALTGWGIVCIGQKEYMRLLLFRHSIFNAGPAEFLGLLQNASFVVSNSFHGIAFSINYRKPFFVPINRALSPEKTLNSRISSLLQKLKLTCRFRPVGGDLPDKKDLNVDYRLVETRLQEERQRSIEFLRSALGEVDYAH